MADKVISIPVGSAFLFAMEFNGEVPADNEIETEANRLGYTERE